MRCESCIFLTTVLIMVCLIDDVAMASEKRRWSYRRRRRRCQKQNCVPGQWSPWTPCSRSCGPHGHSRKSRPIIKPASCGGTCLVTTVGAKACNRFCLNGGTLIRLSCRCKAGYSGECCGKVSGGWTSWGAWCACSRTCGRGTQYRKRSCTKPGGTGCVGSSKEYRSCIVKQCNLDGGWSSWSSWGQCTGSCGSGLQTRKRTCTNPPPGYGGKKCSGPAEQHKNCLLQRCPVNGGWSAWRPWSKCSKTCGSGVQYTNRYCNNPTPKYGGKPCVGQSRKTRACSMRSCAVDGGWSPWGKWCKCSKTCGTGSQYRKRSCTRPPPGYGGKPCEGQDKQYRTCNTKQCPVHGGWSSWSVWGACSRTCGDGKQYSKRYCNNPVPNGGRKCYGVNVRTRACNVRPCPVNGRWSLWSAWSKCSKTCGYGKQTRFRTCTNPPPKYGGKCVGPNAQAKSCLVKKCPVNGRWSLWSAWSKCSKTCGYGSQTRRRTCTNPPPKYGGKCVGPNTQAKSCLVKKCPVNGGWGAWGNWCACSKTCDTGTQHRSRSCDKPSPAHGGKHCSGQNKEFRNCNTNQCPVNGRWALWARWSSCSKTCGTGSKTRKRSCSNPPAQHGGKPCKGVNEQTKSCLLKTCPTPAYGGWGSWGAWSTCSKTCGTGSQNRKRTCHGGNAGQGNCPGSDEEKRDCNTQKCPAPVVNGGWGDWSEWSACTVSCGPGTSLRTRRCDSPAPGPGGSPCVGLPVSNKPCDLGPCPGNCWGDWSDWSKCTKACGCGRRFRVRFCNCAHGQGHDQCQGLGESSESCNCNDCPNGPPF